MCPRAAWFGLVVLSCALTGCFGGKNPAGRCNEVAEYQLSGSVPDVVVPDGLVAPNRESGYTVPAAGANPEVDGAACLARPPEYFRKDPSAAPAK
jgi:uncharacterized lipoprotein